MDARPGSAVPRAPPSPVNVQATLQQALLLKGVESRAGICVLIHLGNSAACRTRVSAAVLGCFGTGPSLWNGIAPEAAVFDIVRLFRTDTIPESAFQDILPTDSACGKFRSVDERRSLPGDRLCSQIIDNRFRELVRDPEFSGGRRQIAPGQTSDLMVMPARLGFQFYDGFMSLAISNHGDNRRTVDDRLFGRSLDNVRLSRRCRGRCPCR